MAAASSVPRLKDLFSKTACIQTTLRCFRTHGKRLAVVTSVVTCLFGWAATGHSGAIFNFTDSALGGGSRWDAAPRTIADVERSLDSGLRYSVQDGSFQAFRDNFSWLGGLPPLASFQAAVEQAFNSWTLIDPASGLPGTFSFRADLATPVNPGSASVPGGSVGLGAEVDLFATNLGDPGSRGFASFSVVNGPVTLTSGTTGYPGFAISGADITINSNPGALYSLDGFRRLLTHEIGHALGLGDIEGQFSPGRFIDDNLDLSSSAAALATLTNSWALLVDALNPAASLLGRFTVPFGDPGTLTPGVDILMESVGLGIGPTNPVSNLTPLTNDDYGTRQFLYPFAAAVPQPGGVVLLSLGALALLLYGWRHR